MLSLHREQCKMDGPLLLNPTKVVEKYFRVVGTQHLCLAVHPAYIFLPYSSR